MQSSGDRITTYKVEIPSAGLTAGVTTLVLSWLFIALWDLLFLDEAADPTGYGIIRTLAPLAGMIPMALRLLRPEDLDSDEEAYTTFVRFTTLVCILAGLLSIGDLIIPSAEETTRGIWWLVSSRMFSLFGYVGTPLMADYLLRLYRYRSKLSVPKLARFYTQALIVVTGFFGCIPYVLDADGIEMMLEITYGVGGMLGLIGLVLSARANWIVNLRKKRKFKLVGLALLGVIAASLFLGITSTSPSHLAFYSFAPGIPTLTFAVGLSMLLTQAVTLFNALLSIPTANAIDRRNIEVDSLANFARLLTGSLDIRTLTDTAIAIACDVTDSEAAWIELREGTSREILYGTSPRLPMRIANLLMGTRVLNRGTIGEIAHAHRAVEIVGGIQSARWPVEGEKEGARYLRSVAAVPLSSENGPIGTLYVAKQMADGFDRKHVTILNAVADQIALAIEQSRLIRTSFERERLEQEMLIARDLQQRLLPKIMPESIFHEIHAESEPASMVGGDYYDVIAFSDHTIGVLIADVSGKGASAALYMGMVKGIVQALSGTCATPKEFLTKANLALYGSIDNRWFVTMTCAQIVDERRVLRIARAGHCPTLLVRNGQGSYSKPRGIGLAIATPKLFDANLELEEAEFAPGDYAVFFSDGLTEAANPATDEFGYDRLRDAATRAGAGNVSPREMRDAIFDEISTFTEGAPPADDSTIVILRWR